jgi:hypothetical protein
VPEAQGASTVDYKKAVERIYEHLEQDRVESAVMGCLRIARAIKDFINGAEFLRELYPNKTEVVRALYDDIAPLKNEAKKFVFEKSLDRWLELHTVDYMMTDGDLNRPAEDRHNVLMIAAGEIDPDLQQCERAIVDMALPQGMGEFDTAAFTDRLLHEKAWFRLRIRCLQAIKSRLKTRCLNFAIQIERQLDAQRQNQSFLESVQNDVNNFFKERSEEVFSKLQKAAQLALSTDGEDSALLLTEVRRAMKAGADHFYPAVADTVKCSDNINRQLGEEQYLNRLHEFLATQVARSTSKDLLKEELDHLTAFLRRLNEIASKGVHSDVTYAEARQGLIGLYFFFFNLIQHLTRESVATTPEGATTQPE